MESKPVMHCSGCPAWYMTNIELEGHRLSCPGSASGDMAACGNGPRICDAMAAAMGDL